MMNAEATKLEWLRSAIAEGIASADAGDVVVFDEAFIEDVKRRGRERARGRGLM